MKRKDFLYLFFLCCFGGTSICATRYDELMCEEKGTIFNTLTQRFRRLVSQHDRRVSTICPKLADYISHAVITRDTCPSLPLVRNVTFRDTVLLMNQAFNSRCASEGYHIKTSGCSAAMVNSMVDNCNRFVDLVQPSLPRHEVCQISKDFIACMEHAQDVCDSPGDSRLLQARYVPQAVQVTQEALEFLCDPNQRFAEWEHGPSNTRNTRSSESQEQDKFAKPECPSAIAAGKTVSDFCNEEKDKEFAGVSLSSDHNDICRVLNFMHACSTDLFDKCADLVSQQDKSFFYDNYPVVFKAYGCQPQQ